MAVAFIFIGITAVSVAITFAAIAVQSAVRSYVAGEGQWSKARRDAAFLLYRYGQTGNRHYLRRFEQALVVPIEDRAARLEMQKPNFDEALVRQRLHNSGHHPADIPALIRLFRCCSQLPQVRHVVAIWEQGDEHILGLQAIGVKLKAEVESPLPSDITINQLLDRVETIHDEVRPLEHAFTERLGDTARRISSRLMYTTATIILILVVLGTYLSLRIIRSIRGSEEQYRALMHSASDGLIVVDRGNGRVLEINECAQRMIGRPAAELIGVPYASLFNDPGINFGSGLDSAGPHLTSLLQFSGQAMEVEVKCSAARWNHHEAQLAIVRDVRRRLRTERMLRVTTNAMANTSEAVVITDGRFRVVSVNSAFTAITGYTEAEVIGRIPGYPGVRSADRRTLRQIAYALRRDGRWQGELLNLRKSGESYPMRLSLAGIPEADGRVTHYVGIFSDNSAFRDYENRLKHLASHDMLTALPNRAAFEETVRLAIHRAEGNGGRLALLFIDLDGFKYVNDTYGHAAGDALLRTLGGRIRRCLRLGDAVARVGGDEFNVLLDDLGSEKDAARLARALLATIGEPVDVDGQAIALSASIGISFYPQDANDVDGLVTHADMAMYEAKGCGRNNFQVFSPQISIAMNTRLALVTGLRQAIERGEFELHYQPHTDLVSGRILGFEALLRWNHPEMGIVSPCQFIPLAEEIGVIDAISDWVLRTACAQGMKWRSRGIVDISLAVNLSPRNFWDPELPNHVAQVLQQSGWPPSLLCLEITEGTIMGQKEAEESLRRLRELGLRLAIDDFGIGYSSLGSLRRFPVDVLKIDRTFTDGIPENSANLALVRTVIALARGLDLTVIAEGIETRAQHEALLNEGCLQGQGYLYGMPMPAAKAEAMLLASRVRPAAELTA
jgi:diguanylate cyclase (GGDEF)-like protein/PAS domain S-box-containing protein